MLMYNSPMKQSAPFLEMTRAICRLLHGEKRRLFGSCPSLAREYMMKLPAFPPGEHCVESGSCWEDQKKITIIIIIVIITIITMMMIKKQTIHYLLLRVLTRKLALQMYYFPFEVYRLRHSNPGQHRQTSFIVHRSFRYPKQKTLLNDPRFISLRILLICDFLEKEKE